MSCSYKNESGRSMVEMLGVLAIIGVLSVGGIAGYTSAMRQHKANEILNAASMLYMMGASQNQGAGDKQMLYSAVLGTVPSGVSEITYNADKTITLAFTDTDVCPLVKNKLGDKATGECPNLTVTLGETASGVNETEVDIYQACLDAGTCETYSGDPKDGYCTNGKVDYPYCVTEDESGTDLYRCYSGYCTCSQFGIYPKCYNTSAECVKHIENKRDCFNSISDCVKAGYCECNANVDEGGCSTSTYSCSSGSCYCLNGKTNPPDCDSDAPSEEEPVYCPDYYGGGDCYDANPSCINTGTCECDTWYCLCTDRTKKFPNC